MNDVGPMPAVRGIALMLVETGHLEAAGTELASIIGSDGSGLGEDENRTITWFVASLGGPRPDSDAVTWANVTTDR